MHAGGHAPERLRKAGSIGVPIQFVAAGVGKRSDDVLLRVADDVTLRSVHVLVRAESKLGKTPIIGRVEVHGGALGIRHRDDGGVQRNPVVVVGDGPDDAPVLVEVRKLRRQRLYRAQRRVALRIPGEIVVRTVRGEGEVLHPARDRGLHRLACWRLEGGCRQWRAEDQHRHNGGREKSQESSHPTEPNGACTQPAPSTSLPRHPFGGQTW